MIFSFPRLAHAFALLLVCSNVYAQSITTYGAPKSITGSDQTTLNSKLIGYSTFSLNPLTLWANLNYSGKDTATIRLNTGDVTTKIFLRKSSFP